MAELPEELRLGPPCAPGRHEAIALTSNCAVCSQPTAPATVADEPARTRKGAQRGRYAAYECGRCGDTWVSWWPLQTAAQVGREVVDAIKVLQSLTMAARTRRDMQRWARRGGTADRGYGHDHRTERERRLLLYRPGDRCAHGGEQMWWWPLSVARRFLDLPHNADRSGYLPGLACRRHNRGEGATRGNRMRGAARQWQASRQW